MQIVVPQKMLLKVIAKLGFFQVCFLQNYVVSCMHAVKDFKLSFFRCHSVFEFFDFIFFEVLLTKVGFVFVVVFLDGRRLY